MLLFKDLLARDPVINSILVRIWLADTLQRAEVFRRDSDNTPRGGIFAECVEVGIIAIIAAPMIEL